ncbi:zinc ribbon domain-containing protein [Methanobrevibacter boviskoreani]|uniref:zinc ribbon domain-containing protein n=1 Tax=Methanobrevibacter boviskoreani TaxID=1348249 RepID=UPI0023EF768B|nr:zinc ribbon domain-containing protein [Methanobrevibacter boviskoreani]MDD6256279.1 hypothetical protein [Methanobrevibacter boviskoreani]
MKCPNCGTDNNNNEAKCRKCGYNLDIIKEYNARGNDDKLISKIDSNTSFIGVMIGFIIFGISLFLSSFLYNPYLINGTISYTIYLGIIILTSLFTGSFVMGIISCNNLKDANTNGLSFLIISYLIILGSLTLSYASNSLPSTIISNSVGSVINTTTLSSNSTANNMVNSMELIAFLIIGLAVIFIGAYLGTILVRLIQRQIITKN